MNAIEVSKLSKTYPGGVEAVKSISFDVAAGEVFGLLGPNGAGKSTTVGMLTTTIEPTAGEARRRPLPERTAESRDPRPSLGRRAAGSTGSDRRARRHARSDRPRRPARW